MNEREAASDDAGDREAEAGGGALTRMVAILRAFAEAPSALSIKELTRRLNLPPSTVHRQLAILTETGIVSRDARSHTYAVGPELARLAVLIAGRRALRHQAMPFMQRVVDRVGEACVLVEAAEAIGCVVATAVVNSANPLRYDVAINVTHAIQWGATGKSVLSFLPRAEQERLHRAGGASPTGRPLPPADAFLAELDAIRARGYAITFGEKIEGAVGMGAPITGPAGRVVGSLCITIPELRFARATVDAFAAVLREQAAALGREIGGGGLEMPG